MIRQEDRGSQEAQDLVGVQGAGESGAEEGETALRLRVDAGEEEEDTDEQGGRHHQRQQQVIGHHVLHDDRCKHGQHTGVVKD